MYVTRERLRELTIDFKLGIVTDETLRTLRAIFDGISRTQYRHLGGKSTWTADDRDDLFANVIAKLWKGRDKIKLDKSLFCYYTTSFVNEYRLSWRQKCVRLSYLEKHWEAMLFRSSSGKRRAKVPK